MRYSLIEWPDSQDWLERAQAGEEGIYVAEDNSFLNGPSVFVREDLIEQE